jgi:hypothetical protein
MGERTGSFFIRFFEDSLLVQGEQSYCRMGLQVGPAFFAFSRPPFAARLRTAEPLVSFSALLGAFTSSYSKKVNVSAENAPLQ